MVSHKCAICLFDYDDDKEMTSFDELAESWRCPVCKAPKESFIANYGYKPTIKKEVVLDLNYDPNLVLTDNGTMDYIHKISVSGTSPGEAMDTLENVPNFKDVLILGAQLSRFPLMSDEIVDVSVTIGKSSKKPMKLSMPIFVSHMSFGALSKNAKIALSKGSALAGTGMCSGEGGVLPEEMSAAHKYIFEYVPNKYSCTDEVFQKCDAIEIKIGQGTKPGMGGHLPGEKVTKEIAEIRGKTVGKDVLSPSRFEEITSPEDLQYLVNYLRNKSEGKPIGVKIAAGHIEEDLEFISKSGCDFITIDGRGGATGSSPQFLKEVTTVPTVYAVSRARKYMDKNKMKQELIITGGLRTSGDVVKAIAMGADAVAMASAPLIALGCQRYRVCGSGKCPMGIATQDPELYSRLDIEVGAKRVSNFFNVMKSEIETFCRITGHKKISEFGLEDICTTDSEISNNCGIKHA